MSCWAARERSTTVRHISLAFNLIMTGGATLPRTLNGCTLLLRSAAARQDILQFHARVLAARGCVRAGSRRAVTRYRTTLAAASQLSGGRARTPAVSYRRGQPSRTNLVKQPRTLGRRFARSLVRQLARATSGWHVEQDVARFSFIRDWRAAVLTASSSPGMWSPVPKYISSGV